MDYGEYGAGTPALTQHAIRRSYSDEEKAEALLMIDACRGMIREAEELTGIPYDTLYGWSKGRAISPAILQLKFAKRQPMQERLTDMSHRLMDAMSAKIEGASLRDTAVTYGILVDKALAIHAMELEDKGSFKSINIDPSETVAAIERLAQKAARPES